MPPTSNDLPTTISVETVSACNRTCWFCKFGQPRGDEKVTTMPWSLIKHVVGQLASISYTGRVSWFRINEPLLDKRLPEIIRLTRKSVPGCLMSLLTNGDLLDAGKAAELLEAGLDRLTISAYDDATLARVKDFAGVKVLDRRPDTEHGFVENRGGNILGAEMLNYKNRGCSRPSTAMNVLVDGRVALCCGDLHGDQIMGDLASQTIEEVWNGPRFTDVRARLTNGRRGLPLCENCTHDGGGHRRDYPNDRDLNIYPLY